jgi:hypothetical protein
MSAVGTVAVKIIRPANSENRGDDIVEVFCKVNGFQYNSQREIPDLKEERRKEVPKYLRNLATH